MSSYRLSHRYAKSLLGLAKEKGQLDEVVNDIRTLNKALDENRDFKLLLKSPLIKGDKKEAIIKSIFQGKVTDMTMAFMTLLCRKGREEHLAEIDKAFIEEYNQLKHITPVKLTTAVKVDDKLVTQVQEMLKKQEGLETIEMETAIDESLIGGFVLEYNHKLYDASVSRRLKELKTKFEDDSYIKKF